MGTLSKEGLQLVCDSVLIRNAQVLRRAIEAIEEKGFVPKGHGLIEVLHQNLQVMEKEIARRDLKLPGKEEGFLQGVTYTSSSQRRGGSGGLDSRIPHVSARVSK